MITATRTITIDMAHRVPDHASKCRNLHGHTYKIIATIEGELATEGQEKGMVMDFGFLKATMMEQIDKHYDHGICLYKDDPVLARLLGPKFHEIRTLAGDTGAVYLTNGEAAEEFGAGKIVVSDLVPTAENLAKIWYGELAGLVYIRSGHRARLRKVRVWETPNCYAEYRP